MSIPYDFLIIASGAKANFYGNELLHQHACTVDNVLSAKKISDALYSRRVDAVIIGGGGYTGIEVATNVRLRFGLCSTAPAVVIVEKSGSLLGPLPDWMKTYVSGHLRDMHIDVMAGAEITRLDGTTVTISNEATYANALAVWTAGVTSPEYTTRLAVERRQQGRIAVDAYLRATDTCFVAGDAAGVTLSEGGLVRMGVQFAVAQGAHSADNIIRCINGTLLKKYTPVDLGYIVPLANNRSCGTVMGIDLRGLLPTAFHYGMCAYRTYGLCNKIRMMVDVLKARKRVPSRVFM